MRLLRIALAQVNTTVGDLDGNAALVLKGLDAARAAQADLVVFPELTITGYPPEDLLLRPQFITGNLRFREEMLATRAMDNLVAVAYVNQVGGQDELVFDGNSLVVDQSGSIVARGRAFEEDLVVADIDADAVARARLHDTRRRRARRLLERRGVTVDRVVLSARYRATHRRPAHGGLPAVPSPLDEVYR